MTLIYDELLIRKSNAYLRTALYCESRTPVWNCHMLKPVLIVFSALCLIVAGDTAGKLLTQAGFSPFFVAWMRFAIAAVALLPLCGLKMSELRSLLNFGVLLRSVLIVAGICSILTALRTEPIANVFGAFFISPIVSFFLSARLLKERITLVRTGLLFLGFIGVMLVIKPGFGMSLGILFALLAGGFHGAYFVATRWLAAGYRPRFLLISQLLVGAIILSPLGLIAETPQIDINAGWLIVLSALGSAAGNYLLVVANRTTAASLIAPLIYTQLIAATGAGYLVFGDLPDLVAMIGLALILASGLLSFAVTGLAARSAPTAAGAAEANGGKP